MESMEKNWVVLKWRWERAMRPRRGMNILDNLYSLGLVAVLIVVVLGTGLYARSLYQEQRATYLLTQIVQGVSSTFQNTRTYGVGGADLIPTLDGYGRLPQDFRVQVGSADPTLEHPFGGAVTVTVGATLTNRYVVTFAALDDDICASLAGKTAGQSSGRSGLAAVTVGGGTALTLPYTATEAEADCDEGTGANAVAWTYF